MIEKYVRRKETHLAQLLTTPAGPHLDEFTAELHHQGFSHWTLRGRLVGAAHFSLWNEKKGRKALEQLHEDALAGFQRHLQYCRCPRPFRPSRKSGDFCAMAGALALIRLLRGNSVIHSPPPSSPAEEHPALIRGFIEWMRKERGLKETTLRGYCGVLVEAVNALGRQPNRYTARALRDFVRRHSMRAGKRQSAKVITTAMRAFMRYLIAEGLCRPGMDDAIPTIAVWRLSTLPRYLPAADVNRIINSCDESTPVGLRDRAALLLLARLGLRAGDIRDMRIDDLDWRQSSLRVSGKGHVEVRLPLTQEVGDAVLRYLQLGRPPAQTDHLLVRMLAPWGVLGRSAVSTLVKRAMDRAGIEFRNRGAHVLRHSAATQLLREGATLAQIGAVLRHQYADTTAHYAKVDVQRLREIALPWPTVTLC
jgi:site-specific recombinase XerD